MVWVQLMTWTKNKHQQVQRYYSGLFAVIILFISCFFELPAEARIEHHLLRRVAVFPIAEANLSNSEESWWQMREALTHEQRFMVASRRFMINRGVFQPRKILKPADVIILSKILDAQMLITVFIDERTLKLKVYEGENGYLLWQGDMQFHPAIAINDQLIRVSTTLMNQFISEIPYQGFVVIDDLMGKPVYSNNNEQEAKIYVGKNSKIAVGDPLQFVEISGQVGQSFFNDNPLIDVIAEGNVKEIKGEYCLARIEKVKNLADVKAETLVRFPQEISRLKEIYSQGEKSSNLSAEYLSGELTDVKDLKSDHPATASALSWIAGFVGFLLLAF